MCFCFISMFKILILVPTIIQGCIPTYSPDDMVTVPIVTTTTEVITTTTVVTTTTTDNSMCQQCPNPFNCASIPTGALTCDAAPGGMVPMVMRGMDECTLTDVTCPPGENIFALEADGVTWTDTGFTQYLNGLCPDSDTRWICDGRPVERIVCAVPDPG